MLRRQGFLCKHSGKNKLYAAFLPLLALPLLFPACSGDSSGWKGTVTEEDGVTIIRNPKTPLYGEGALVLEEDLHLGGAEESEELMFSGIRSFDVDDSGNIYVLDRDANEVRVFDAGGRFRRTIGKPGQGPGEFQAARTVAVTAGGRLMVQDLRSRLMSYFTLGGRFLERVSAARHFALFRLKVGTDGNCVAIFSGRGSSGIRKYDHEFNPLFTVAEEAWDPGWNNTGHLPSPDMVFSLLSSDEIVWGYSSEYTLSVVSPDGRLSRTISREYDPVPVTPRHKREMVETIYGSHGIPAGRKIVWADHFPAYSNISCDDEGRIFVTTYEYLDEEERLCLIDVFDPRGRYAAAFPLALPNNHTPLVNKRGKLYALDEDEDGYQCIRRYRLIWKL